MPLLIRLNLDDRPGTLAQAASAIAECGGNILAMDVADYDLDNKTVTDDFVVDLPASGGDYLVEQLCQLPGCLVEFTRPTLLTELHRELEFMSNLVLGERPSLDLLASLVPAIVRCDWAAIIQVNDDAAFVSHASAHASRIRWTSLPWMPLVQAKTLDAGADWVPASWHSSDLAIAAAPMDRYTSVLACRTAGPRFLRLEVEQLAQAATLAGRLLPGVEMSYTFPTTVTG